MRSAPVAAAFAAALFTVASTAQAAPFSNGSLESTSASTIESVSGSSSANGWSTGSLNIEFVKAGYTNGSDTVGAAQDGDWFVDLNGVLGPGSIQQTFDTVAGQWYRVDYWISGNAGPGGATMADGAKSLQAAWNGSTADSATYAHQSGDNWSNLRWEAHSFLVQASGTSSTLGFQSTSTFYSDAGPFIDSISVTAVPEPATLALWLAGIGLVASAVRRRR